MKILYLTNCQEISFCVKAGSFVVLHTGVLSFVGACLLLVSCQVGVNPPSYVLPSAGLPSSVGAPEPGGTVPKPLPLPSRPPLGVDMPGPEPSPVSVPTVGGGNDVPIGALPTAVPVDSGSRGGSGGGGSKTTLPDQLRIQDIRWHSENMSVMGPDPTDALIPDYQGGAIELRLTGSFRTPQLQPLSLADFTLSPASSWQAETFLGEIPAGRVLLNESLLLTPAFVSATEIRVLLDPKYIPDLYLKGMHRLRVEHEDWYTDALLKVGDPIPPPESLAPVIMQVEVLRQSGEPRFIQLTGKHFMLYPKFSHATIDGEFGFGYRTQVTSDGVFTTQIHVPDPATFDDASDHLVIYTTPYGVAFYEF